MRPVVRIHSGALIPKQATPLLSGVAFCVAGGRVPFAGTDATIRSLKPSDPAGSAELRDADAPIVEDDDMEVEVGD
jgi:hypothetical protein